MNKNVDEEKTVTSYHYHPLYIVKPIFRSLIVFTVFFGQELLTFIEEGFSFSELQSDGIIGGVLLGGGVFLLVMLPSLINAAITYFKSRVELSEETINYRKVTFFSKTSKETPLSQITNLNFNRSILDRLFSTVDVHLDINSSETANESDYHILLSKRDAQEFKDLFDTYRQKQVQVEAEVTNRNTNSQSVFNQTYDYSSFESWRHILLSSSFFILLLIFGLVVSIFTDSFRGFSLFSTLVLFFSFAVDIIRNISKYYDYQVRTNSQSINWHSGLFENKEFTISKNNIRAIELKQTLIARLLNYYSVDIKVVGVGNDGQELMTIILYQEKEEMLGMLKEILPGYQLKLVYERENKLVGIYKSLIAWILLTPLLFFPLIRNHLGIYLITLFVIMASNVLASYGKGFTFDGEEVEILSAYVSLHITRISIKNIEHIKIVKRPFFSKLGLSKIEFYYKDNAGANVISSGYFPDKIFGPFVRQFIGPSQKDLTSEINLI